MINTKKVTINGVEYVAVENKTHTCNGCAFQKKRSWCKKVRCAEIVNKNCVKVVKTYKWKSNKNN